MEKFLDQFNFSVVEWELFIPFWYSPQNKVFLLYFVAELYLSTIFRAYHSDIATWLILMFYSHDILLHLSELRKAVKGKLGALIVENDVRIYVSELWTA